MRKPEFSEADAAGILANVMQRLTGRSSGADNAGKPAEPAAPEQGPMSIVDFTEALVRQVGGKRR